MVSLSNSQFDVYQLRLIMGCNGSASVLLMAASVLSLVFVSSGVTLFFFDRQPRDNHAHSHFYSHRYAQAAWVSCVKRMAIDCLFFFDLSHLKVYIAAQLH